MPRDELSAVPLKLRAKARRSCLNAAHGCDYCLSPHRLPDYLPALGAPVCTDHKLSMPPSWGTPSVPSRFYRYYSTKTAAPCQAAAGILRPQKCANRLKESHNTDKTTTDANKKRLRMPCNTRSVCPLII